MDVKMKSVSKEQCVNCFYATPSIVPRKMLCHLFRPHFTVVIDGHCKKWKSK